MTNERAADEVDCDIFRAMERCAYFGNGFPIGSPRRDRWHNARDLLANARNQVRQMMTEQQRKETA